MSLKQRELVAATKNELRCFCRGAPLLGMYGVDRDGEPYVHVKIYKQNRVFGEVWHSGGGKVRLRCRNCFRVSLVVFIQDHGRTQVKLEESAEPIGADENPIAQ